ncbi:hypothetical protein Rs2_10662 [Raphanus sativus]|nr:hypothetical protein Rs2_10662 [Raphanus sativus]
MLHSLKHLIWWVMSSTTVEGNPYQRKVLDNRTVEVVESGGLLSREYVFLLTLGIAIHLLLGLWAYSKVQRLSKRTKKVSKVEVGTRSTDASLDEWLEVRISLFLFLGFVSSSLGLKCVCCCAFREFGKDIIKEQEISLAGVENTDELSKAPNLSGQHQLQPLKTIEITQVLRLQMEVHKSLRKQLEIMMSLVTSTSSIHLAWDDPF